ncbi:MAG: T9SS type A sorting domain-containing protein [Ignavibacteriales bacterium]|nr:T9SS type A sorting domain-containing protein [Ignavibacteriales bacterium]
MCSNDGNSFIILNTSGTIDSNFVSLDIQDGLYLSVIKNSNNITLVIDSVGVLDVEEINDGEIVNDFSLSQNYPNPFNPSTNIQFALPHSGYVTLEIFSVTGERVDVLISEELNAGKYNYEWNGSNLTSGIYFYRLNAGNFVETRKMILLK